MLFAKLDEGLPKKSGKVADMGNPAPDFARLGRAVHAYRLRRGLSQREVAGAGGPSDTTQSQIEAGTWTSARPGSTLAKLDKGYGWPVGTAQRVATGELDGSDLAELDVLAAPDPARMPVASGDIKTEIRADIEEMSTEDLRAYHAELLAAADDLGRQVSTYAAQLAQAQTAQHSVKMMLNRIAVETNIRERFDTRGSSAGAQIVTLPQLQGVLEDGALAASQAWVGDQQADAMLVTRDGQIIVVEFKHLTSADSARQAVAETELKVASAEEQLGRKIRGVVLDTEGVSDAAILRALAAYVSAETPKEFVRSDVAWGTDWRADLADAARTTGQEGALERQRREHAAAGEESQDPEDAELR